jgi:hypothetical protein
LEASRRNQKVAKSAATALEAENFTALLKDRVRFSTREGERIRFLQESGFGARNIPKHRSQNELDTAATDDESTGKTKTAKSFKEFLSSQASVCFHSHEAAAGRLIS